MDEYLSTHTPAPLGGNSLHIIASRFDTLPMWRIFSVLLPDTYGVLLKQTWHRIRSTVNTAHVIFTWQLDRW